MKTTLAWLAGGIAALALLGCTQPAETGAPDAAGSPAGDAAVVTPTEPPAPPVGPRPQGEEKDGQPVGHWVFFHANGQKSAEGDYEAGQKHGAWTYWYDNGQKTAEGRFERGVKIGRWLEWDEAGQQVADKTFVDGIEALPPR